MKNYYFTSESVTEGHPDKLCDYISDSILDECLKQDENSRVAIETFVSGNTVTIAGQITSTARIKISELVREKIKEIKGCKSRCIINEKLITGKCVCCGKPAKYHVIWGVQY